MSLVVGAESDVSGERLFATPAVAILDQPIAYLHDLAHEASRKGFIDYRSRGQVTEISLDALTGGEDDRRLPLMDTA